MVSANNTVNVPVKNTFLMASSALLKAERCGEAAERKTATLMSLLFRNSGEYLELATNRPTWP